MTKEELIEKVASGAGLSKADASRALGAIIGSITSALKKGRTVALERYWNKSQYLFSFVEKLKNNFLLSI